LIINRKAISLTIIMMVCPNCGKTVTDDTMVFCPACGFSFTQQPNQPYTPNQYGPPPYGYQTAPQKSVAIAFILSFIIPGVGQIYVGKIKRGIAYLVTYMALYVISTLITMNTDYTDIQAVKDLIASPLFIGIMLVSFGFWAFNVYDAYRLAKRYNEASRRNDLAAFKKGF
jgi:hypothetical protein